MEQALIISLCVWHQRRKKLKIFDREKFKQQNKVVLNQSYIKLYKINIDEPTMKWMNE